MSNETGSYCFARWSPTRAKANLTLKRTRNSGATFAVAAPLSVVVELNR